MGEIVENMESEATQQQFKDAVMDELSKHPFHPPAWLRNPHLQTVGARYLRKVEPPTLCQERWATPDDDFVDLYFLEGDPEMPLVFILHGLEGSVESTYMHGLLQELAKFGWNAAVMEFRSCSGEMNRAKRLYHSGETTDADWAVGQLAKRYPGKPIYMAGYSLGGNVTAKWLGELGDGVPDAVKGAAVISAPYDLVSSGKHMDNSISRLYVLHFLRMLIPKAVEKEQQYPGSLDIERIKKARTFAEFDTHATAALHGFDDSHDYYTKVQCGQFLDGIRRPTLLLSSADDPFNPGHSLPREIADFSSWLFPQFTDRGGHVGFIRKGDSGLGYWAEEQTVRFFRACHARS